MRAAAAPALLLCVIAGSGCGSTAPAAPEAPHAAVTQPSSTSPARASRPAPVRPRRGETLGAAITHRTALLARPGGRLLFHVSRRTTFGSDRVLAVIRQRGQWLGVASEDLANGRLGWVRQRDVSLRRELWQIRVDLSARRATLLRRGRPYRSFPVAVGSPSYATPPGRYGVTDRLDTGGAGSPYGCCILALTGHQPNVPQDWPGGDRIALHGTSDPASVGNPVTHGCLRASEATMRMLLARVPLGARIVIRA